MMQANSMKVFMKKDQGFSSVEMLIAAVLSAIVLSSALGAFNSAAGLAENTNQMTDLEQNLRAGVKLLVRDFINAGWGVPTGGISIPSGANSTAVKRPGPPDEEYTFGTADVITAVSPGASLGPEGNGQNTDMVNILFADSTLPLNQTPLVSIATNGASALVNSGTPITGISNAIRPGDLIAFSNGIGNTIQYVTRVDGQRMYFATSSADELNFNQPTAAAGSITQLQSGGVFPTTTATRVWLITYYLDYTTDPNTPRLIRRVNNRPGAPVALVLENLQLTYDLVDGDTNPAKVENPGSPNQIRKANILLSGRSSERIRNTQEFLRTSLTTQVSLRSLSFVDRYE
jgi:hypothetical protein